MTDRIICDCCDGSGRDTAGHNFINTGGACENCGRQGSWESEGTPVEQFNAAVDREIARQQLTECAPDPLKHLEPKRRAA